MGITLSNQSHRLCDVVVDSEGVTPTFAPDERDCSVFKLQAHVFKRLRLQHSSSTLERLSPI
jgi:hypothetical protein